MRERYRQYTDFLSLVSLSNNLEVKQSSKIDYSLFVGKGNNSPLIKSLFRTYRPWWRVEDLTANDEDSQMTWHQLRQNRLLDGLKDNIKTDADL